MFVGESIQSLAHVEEIPQVYLYQEGADPMVLASVHF